MTRSRDKKSARRMSDLPEKEKPDSPKTEWVYIYGSFLMKKNQIKECQITEIADRYNIRCTKEDGKCETLLPNYIPFTAAAQVLKEIKEQLEE